MINEGYGMTFSAGMQYEVQAAKEFARSIANDHVAVRRENVFRRGRRQTRQ
jgi:hypothetical protein